MYSLHACITVKPISSVIVNLVDFKKFMMVSGSSVCVCVCVCVCVYVCVVGLWEALVGREGEWSGS